MRRAIKLLLADGVIFLLLFTIFALMYQFIYGDMTFQYLLLAIPFYFLLFIRLARNMTLFLLSHLCLLAVPLLLPMYNSTIIFTFLLASVVYSVIVQLKEGWTLQFQYSILAILINTVIISFFEVSYAFTSFLRISPLLILTATVLYTHVDNLDHKLSYSSRQYKRPTRHVVAVNNAFISIFIVLTLGFGAFVLLFPVAEIFTAIILGILRLISQILLFILTTIFNVVSHFFPDFYLPIDYPTEELVPIVEVMVIEEALEEYDDIGQRIFNALIAIVGVLLSLTALAFIGSKLHKSFATGRTAEDDIRSSLLPDDALGKLKFIMDSVHLPSFKKPDHPMRKAYIKKVNSHIKKGIPIMSFDTPERIADKIRPHEDIDELTKLYERARYGEN